MCLNSHIFQYFKKTSNSMHLLEDVCYNEVWEKKKSCDIRTILKKIFYDN